MNLIKDVNTNDDRINIVLSSSSMGEETKEKLKKTVIDADITGPSIPRMFGITKKPEGDESGIIPVKSKTGILIMSINLLLFSEDEAVVWRGPSLWLLAPSVDPRN
jgi:Mrp family chromosome partitioning ATPase